MKPIFTLSRLNVDGSWDVVHEYANEEECMTQWDICRINYPKNKWRVAITITTIKVESIPNCVDWNGSQLHLYCTYLK